MLAGVTVTELLPGDAAGVEAARRLLNRLLGEGLYTHEKLAGCAADPSAVVMVAWRHGSVLAAAVGRLLEPEDAEYYLPFGVEVRDIFRRGRVGSLEALAVSEQARHEGLGRRLIEARLEWLAARGCAVAVAVSWLSGSPDTSAPLFEELGFAGTAPNADFYLAESIRDGWACPLCQGPCRCAASLYHKLLL